jgi:hypothetical protein
MNSNKLQVKSSMWCLKWVLILLIGLSPLQHSMAAWPVHFGGEGDEEIIDMTVDGRGNIIVVGMFVNKNYFPTEDNDAKVLESAGDKDIFVASYSSGGDVNWVRSVGGAGTDTVSAVAVDHDNFIYINGNIGNGDATFGSDRETSLTANKGFSGKFSAGGSKAWANTTANGFTARNDVDLALYTKSTFDGQNQEQFASGIFGGYTAVAKSWKGYLSSIDADGNSIDADGNSVVTKMLEGGVPEYRQEVSRIAAVSATEVYVLGKIGGHWSNAEGEWCGTNIDGGGDTYPYKGWVFVSKYAEIDGAWTCQWLKKVDEREYRGDIVTDNEGDVYYYAAGLVKRLASGTGAVSTLGQVEDRSLFIKPSGYTARHMKHVSTDLGGLAVDDEQNVYISGAYTGEPVFTDPDRTNSDVELRAVTAPTLFVAKLTANVNSAEPPGWKWATPTSVDETPGAVLAQKNARIGLTASGNTVFVAGSTSGYERFDESIVGSGPGALRFDGDDNRLAFAVPDAVPNKKSYDYELSFKVKIPADAEFPLSLVNSPLGNGPSYQIIMRDTDTLEIHETKYSFSDDAEKIVIISFDIGSAVNNDNWHEIQINTSDVRKSSIFSPTKPYELIVDGTSFPEQGSPEEFFDLELLLPETLLFGKRSTELANFEGLLADLSIKLIHYSKTQTPDPDCSPLEICFDIIEFIDRTITQSKWTFRQSEITGSIIRDVLGTNDIHLANPATAQTPTRIATDNYALSFDGVDNVVAMPIPHDPATEQIPLYEIGFKVWFADIKDDAYPQVLMSDNARFHLIMESPTVISLIEDRDENTQGVFQYQLTVPLQGGKWHDIKVMRTVDIFPEDPEFAVRAEMWVNEAQIFRSNPEENPWLYDAAKVDINAFNAKSVSIGQTTSDLTNSGYPTPKPFNGYMDNLYINAEVYPSAQLAQFDPDGSETVELPPSELSLRGLWAFNTPLTDPKIPNLAGSGASMDIAIDGMTSAQLPSQLVNTGLDPRDGYISLLDAVSGDWLLPKTWKIGEAIATPDGALKLQPDIKIDGVLALDYSSYLFWSPSEGKLYAIGEAPGIVTIEWKTSPDSQNETRVTTLGSPIQSSSSVQVHIAGTSVALEPAHQAGDSEHALLFSGLVYPANSNNLVSVNSQGKLFTRPSVLPGQSPYVVLQYTVALEGEVSNTQTQESVFQVVYTHDWQDEDLKTKGTTCEIGQPLTKPSHDFNSGRNGHVVNALSRYDASIHSAGIGPIIPVNKRASDESEDFMGVVWFTANNIGQYWADTPVEYECAWPQNTSQIVIADQQGFAIAPNMTNPVIYQQNDPSIAGFNLNEEHALFNNNKLYALRNDLNAVIQTANPARGSEPYVLLKYQDSANDDLWTYKVVAVEASTAAAPFAPAQGNELYSQTAGNVLSLPQPLNNLGSTCEENKIEIDSENGAWEDHTGVTWVRAASAFVGLSYYYPLLPSFDYDLNVDGEPDAISGTCVPWLDQVPDRAERNGLPLLVSYRFEWPASVPIMKPGSTLLEPIGEVPCSDGATGCTLPNISGQAAAQIIYDQSIDGAQGAVSPADALVKLFDPISARAVPLEELNGVIATVSSQGKKFFSGLPSVLRSRLSYDDIQKQLSFRGILDGIQIGGDPRLLPNIMTEIERDLILGLTGANTAFKDAVEALYALSRNPNQLDLNDDKIADSDYLIGLQPKYLGIGIDTVGDGFADVFTDENPVNGKHDDFDDPDFSLPANQFVAPAVDTNVAQAQAILGTPLALTAGRPASEGYITLTFNNDPSITSKIDLKVIKLSADDGVYQGSIWVVPSDNVFEESLTLRHTGDFAGDPNDIVFSWYYQPDTNGQPFAPANESDLRDLWRPFPANDKGKGALDITISGPGLLTLTDNWFIVHYGGKGTNTGLPVGDNNNTPSPWAGDPSQPANAPKAMLATGWIKRVIAGLNPFDQRVKNFRTDSISTLTSMIAQAGKPFAGAIPFNPDPAVINNIGIIEAYQTVLNRGKQLSIEDNINDIAANTQLLNASTRIADLYMLLGNEAYADAQDPTIGFDTNSEVGSLASSIFTFQNQLVSPLEEELVLLRGRDDSRGGIAGHPVNNRLFWNFTQGTGEVAYVQSYRITDRNKDGFITEADAKILYPQGHGDAWGHYLTSVKSRYELLQAPNFAWIPRTESVLVSGVPFEIDYLDERKFAAAAAAKARTGAEIVNLTYRDKYVEAPSGQWQGYKDTNRERAWGLDGWGRRAGQGAYLDWLTANAILPAVDPNPNHEGIEKIDRTTVPELSQIIAGFNSIQAQLDEADAGLNPLGLAKGVVPFDIDPSFLQVSSSVQGQNHFDQIASRAQKALDNALRVFNHASQQTQSLREAQDDADQLASLVRGQERAFKNQLIEIYGYPYAGNMGGGKLYPSDYDGPDITNYNYVSSDVTGTLPEPNGSFKGFFSPIAFGNTNGFVFDEDSLQSAYTDVDAGAVLTVEFPEAKGAEWLFVAPQAWNKRKAPGTIQGAISNLLQSQAKLKRVLKQHENLLQDIEAAADLVDAEFASTNETIQVLKNKRIYSDNLETAIIVARGAQLAGRTAAKIGEEAAEAAKECFPTTFGFSTDATSGGRCAIKAGVGVYANVAGLAAGDIGEGVELSLELQKESSALQRDINLVADTTNVALLERIKELEKLAREEAVIRLEIFTLSEVVNQSRGIYYSILAQGQRIIDERTAFRVAASGDIQSNRYTDLTFRIFRNDALAKYRAQFDLAARYVYLAAAAYDYETNLLGNDSGSGRKFLADIVRQRSLGQVIDGVPIAGTPGLADVLARLTQNFDVYRGQLGFNNPQVEKNRFSLRKELFRQAGDDELWRKTLEDARVDDLWDVPEFKRYARPFTVEGDDPQPGLVIRFPTTVSFGLNFFGHELGGGDSAYDPTNFATKIRAVGAWFEGYDGASLSNTPRVYLIPVGMDVLRSPSGDDFKTREWQVLDQKLPAPFPLGASDLADPDWIPANDSLSDTYGDIRRMSSFRAYHDSGAYDPSQSISDSRLVGRSVWNTEWMLIIPGGTLSHDSDEGLDRFIHGQLNLEGTARNGEGITDILLHFQTYGFSGN